MRRLTISGQACVETLGILIVVAWADGRLDDKEKAGVRGAATVLNLTKEHRARLDELLDSKGDYDKIKFDVLTNARDKEFAYVAAAWMAGADEEYDPKEEELLDKLGNKLGLDAA